jgi:hypothetical protein
MASLPIGGDNRVQIRNISGLGPVKADVITVPSNKQGDLFQNTRIGKRNIVLTLGLNPNWIDETMSSLRHDLYWHLYPMAWRTFQFISDDWPAVEIKGCVESFEDNMFSQDPEIIVSVICPYPYFVEMNNGIIEWASL